MTTKRYISLLSILTIWLSVCVGQTVVWQMQPSDYAVVAPYVGGLLRVEKNGKTGLVKTDGSVVTGDMCDEVTLFHDGIALLICNEAKGRRVSGCVTIDGIYHAFGKRYYTLKGQEFYSDGVLSVADESGKLGYVDEYGNIVTGFDGRFDIIKPFVGGYAAVFKNKKYHLIDKTGTPQKFSFSNVAELYGGMNPYNGQVYVWDTEGRFYVRDLQEGSACKKVKTPANPTKVDYLYRFSSVTGLTKEVPYTKPAASLPADMEIRTINGRTGILRHVHGESFSAVVKAGSERQHFFSGDKLKCAFRLNVPSVWRDKSLTVTLANESGLPVNTDKQDYDFSFQVKPEKTEKRTYTIKVAAEGLELYEGALTFLFEHKERPKPEADYKKVSTQSDTQCKKCCKKAQLRDGLCADCGKKASQPICKTCGKKISECKYQGVH